MSSHTSAPNGYDDAIHRFRTFQIGRIATCVAVLLAIAAIERLVGSRDSISWIVALVVADLLLTGLHWRIAVARPESILPLTLAVMLIDSMFLTAGIYLLGSEGLWYGLVIYAFLVTMAAMQHSPRAAYILAIVGSAEYAAVIAGVRTGVLPMHSGVLRLGSEGPWPWSSGVANAVGLLAMAVVTSALARAARTALNQSREFEGQLREANAGLESRVREATDSLSRSNNELEERNHELGRTLGQVQLFARAVSHDLRTPVTGASEALRLATRAESGKRDRLMRIASQNLMRADRMLMGLRDTMRFVGSQERTERVDISLLVGEIVSEIESARQGEPQPVRIRGSLGTLVARSDQVAHVFRNLIENALQHGGRSDLIVEIGREIVEGEETWFVADNGQGIAEDLQARIFEPFRMGATDGDHLGLGLTLVAAILERVGGRVWLTRGVDDSTVFRFTWPQTASLETRA